MTHSTFKETKHEFRKIQELAINYTYQVQIFNSSSDSFINYMAQFKKNDQIIAVLSKFGTIYKTFNRFDKYFNINPRKYTREYNKEYSKHFNKSLTQVKDKINNFQIPTEQSLIITR